MTNHIRTPLELWLIVEENFESFFSSGLCGFIHDLFYKDFVNYDEYSFLMRQVCIYGIVRGVDTGLYPIWAYFEKKPRKMFIQKQILKAIRND